MRYRLLVLGFFVIALGVNASANTNNEDGAIQKSASDKSTGIKRNTWVELGAGSVATIEIKTSLGNRGWAIAASGYDDVEFFDDAKLTADGARIDDGVSELALMRTFSKHGRWFYSDASIGVGYMDATLASNCVKQIDGWVDTYLCEKERKKGLSIPMELDIAFGRYVGIGLKLRASIGPESKAGIALTIPLGGFAKR